MPRFHTKPKNKSKAAKKPRGVDAADDSSVDSHGNLRDLIDYDYDETTEESSADEAETTEEELFEMSEEERPKRKPRKASLVAKKRIQKISAAAGVTSSSEDDSTATPPPKRRIKPTLTVISDEESEEEELPKKKTKASNKKLKNSLVLKKKRAALLESEDETEEEEEERRPKKKPVSKRKYKEETSSEDEETAEEDEDEEEDEDYEGETDEEGEEEFPRRKGGSGAIDIVISDLFGGGGGKDPNKPHKYNLKKEPPTVRRFVELVQKEDEGEEDTIDNDITYFKSLDKTRQASLLQVLEHKASPAEVQVPLKFKILEKVAVKPELNRIAMAKYNALCNLEPSSSEYYKCSHWITGFTSLPLGNYKDLPVKMEDGADKCHEFMSTVHKCMDKAIYGHDEAKLQILQFVSSWIANPKANGNVLSIHGPPGIGKTSIIKDGVAKALGRPFHFVSLGGATDASYLDGHSYTYEGSTWGRIAEILIQSKHMNPVIYFDELDKVSETPKGEEIMNLLIHITDQSQNDRFQDKYFTGIDLDLSRCLFIFSHNNHEKVNPILRDRMYNIECKGFSMKEKLLIAEEYLLPQALKESGLHEKISISKEILQHIVEDFTGGEAGVRELKRCLQTIVSKINLLRFYNNPKQVPFAIEGFALPFTLKRSHVELFLKKKAAMDASIQHLYL
jgi:flagellar biosynthesis GTPase FlhF